jgi:hypothetical protein
MRLLWRVDSDDVTLHGLAPLTVVMIPLKLPPATMKIAKREENLLQATPTWGSANKSQIQCHLLN